jgi:fido (protein-threonine AMPylation protein)
LLSPLIRASESAARYSVEHKTFAPDQIAIWFSHCLVSIHPFPNRNGRFSRMVGGLLAVQLGEPCFSSGSANLVDPKETRRTYIEALRSADNHDFTALIAFARIYTTI